MRSTLFTSNQGKFDPVNSTYRHEIYLSNGKILTGYSKGLNLPELADKDTLIQRVTVRLFRNGYLHPQSKGKSKETACIAFFTNHPVDPELIVFLYPKTYELATEELGNSVLINFLDRFYEMIKTGAERTNLVKLPRQRDVMSLDIKFESHEQAIKYALSLTEKYGISHGLAKKWLREWLAKNGATFN